MQGSPVRHGIAAALLAQASSLALLLGTGGVSPAGAAAGAGYAVLCAALIDRGLRRSGAVRVGPANAVTWARCVLVGAVVALAVAPPPGAALPLAALAAVALLLDGIDGRVARATGTVSAFGARFDMEVDASLVLALSAAAAPRVGTCVLLVGAARYLLLVAALVVPRLAAPTPPRLWRKAVAAVQGIVLTAVASGLLPPPLAVGVAAAAALALAWSFGTQIASLLAPGPTRAPVAAPVDA
ncbi:CDP-alcohol phosphatidyltransferase family protein [Amnibacterium sp. CER49]|uniref:CDP-alcohol phosphatidyltransferase family protein n=1 Tax=Amnibacterium sp. CER49 TaxID=3039161 RepID=UPI00244685DE|nr:CDP-alcohol phosphatidyltransferase family protein [Amnibacterium sp. CER49]MDH2443763.1 CDP-alcohol phosphatidyltransferase family protein [Amnibacterium sp. CER49]